MTSKVIEGHKSSSNFNPTLLLLDGPLMFPPLNFVVTHVISFDLKGHMSPSRVILKILRSSDQITTLAYVLWTTFVLFFLVRSHMQFMG